MSREVPFRKGFLLFLVVAMSCVLVVLLQAFLMTILVAVVLAGLTRPIYVRLCRRFGGRAPLAAGVTVVGVLLGLVVPLGVVGGLVVNQAASMSENIKPMIDQAKDAPDYLDVQLRRVPGYDKYLSPYRTQILTKVGDVIRAAGSFLAKSLSSGTLSTVSFIGNFFLALYAMFFFLLDGPRMLKHVLDHVPLHDDEKEQLKDRFMSITRATLKGTLVIGLVQGTMTGMAFWVAGIPSVAFWTVLMVLLSVIPLIGGAIIWIPACIVLFAQGAVLKAVLLALFCSLVVGSVDNLMRPWLVGRDTKLHDLVILFSTLGGLVVIGPLGFVLGPVLAGLFVTSWQIFRAAYREQLDRAKRA